jgi:hypothetical protein
MTSGGAQTEEMLTMGRKKSKNNKSSGLDKHKPGRKKPVRNRKESLREIYARIRRDFTAADLAQFAEPEVGIPARQVLAEMDVIHEREMHKKV